MDAPHVGVAWGQSALLWQMMFFPVPVQVAAQAVSVTRFKPPPPPTATLVAQQTLPCAQLALPLQPMVGVFAPQACWHW
jgi:hypothetical protein